MFKIFKSKKDYEKAVQAEVEKALAKDKQERKQVAEKMWAAWEKLDPIDLLFDERAKIGGVYAEAETLYKSGNPEAAFVKINEVINRSALLEGEIIGLYVFILLIDIKKALKGKAGVLEAYDAGIDYYSSVDGEHVQRWLEHLQMMKADYLKHEELIEGMRERYGFTLSDDLVIALQRLEGIVVYRFIPKDHKFDSFDDVWKAVQKEVEDFEQGAESKNLNKTTYKGAKTWVTKFAHLCSEPVPEEYSNK